MTHPSPSLDDLNSALAEFERLNGSLYAYCNPKISPGPHAFHQFRSAWNNAASKVAELLQSVSRPDYYPEDPYLLRTTVEIPAPASLYGLVFPGDLILAPADADRHFRISEVHVNGTVRIRRASGSADIEIEMHNSQIGGLDLNEIRANDKIIVCHTRLAGEFKIQQTSFGHSFGILRFISCTFEEDVSFQRIVPKDLWFKECVFKNLFTLLGSLIKGRADFRNSTFEAIALFDGTRFEGPTSFRRTLFRDKVSFDHTTFRCLPDFVQAVIGQPPDFDLVRIDADPGEDVLAFHREDREEAREAAGGARESEPGEAAEAVDLDDPLLAHRERAARWRALWRLAEAGGNHRRALDFRAEERRARRPVDWRERRWDWLLGWASELLSDFGRRPHRALGWWVACTFVFFVVYLDWACLDWAEEPGRRTQVFVYTLHHALVVGGLRGQGLSELAAELFGEPSAGLLALNLAQNLLSALFLGAFVLAVRNLLRPR